MVPMCEEVNGVPRSFDAGCFGESPPTVRVPRMRYRMWHTAQGGTGSVRRHSWWCPGPAAARTALHLSPDALARYPCPVMTRKSFASDNHAGALPEVVRAIADANAGDAIAYGDDDWTRTCSDLLIAASGASEVYFVLTGTAANVLALSLLLRPYDAVICANSTHLNVDECGAPERVLGCKLLAVPTPDGKLTPELIAPKLGDRGDEHRAQPRVVALAQVTELGTCYSLAELTELRQFCESESLYLFMDGARLANAAAHLRCDLADLARTADVLTFGGTKNGAIAAEAVIVMNNKLAGEGPFLRKQQMQLTAKMRFVAAQFIALLTDGLWLRSAQHANEMAQRLARFASTDPGVTICYPVQSNAVFAELSRERLVALGREWTFSTANFTDRIARWMTAFNTSAADVDAFAAAILATSGAGEVER